MLPGASDPGLAFLPWLPKAPPPTARPPLQVDLVVLVQRSPSLDGDRLERLRAGLSGLVGPLVLGPDQIALLAFDGEASILVPLTAQAGAFEAGLRRLAPGEGGRFDRGLRAGRHVLLGMEGGAARNHAHRGVILLVTDDAHHGSANEAIAESFFTGNAGLAVTALALGPRADRALLGRMTDRWFDAPSEADLDPALADFVGWLRAR